jgi:hypothetical protein
MLRAVVMVIVVRVRSLGFQMQDRRRLQNDRGQNQRYGGAKRHRPPPPVEGD